jgi:predicted PurR-regulated permease PerM
MAPERVVLFRPRTILQVVGVLLGIAIALWVVWISRRVLTWVFVALFLTLALEPAVRFLQHRGLTRGAAAAIIYLVALLVAIGLGALLLPPLIDQIRGLADAAPGYVHDLTKGRGPLGFLERKYHVVEKVREATKNGGASTLAGGAGTVVSIGRSVVTSIVAFVTVVFLMLFMILEGPAWVQRGIGLMPVEQRPRWRSIGDQIAQTVSGYVTGNLLLSVIAGGSSTIVLLILGVPFALALGLLVAILDLIPLAGATVAGIVLGTVGFLTSITAGVIVVVFFVVYQQIENHVLQPLVYGRTVQLTPLVVLISVLIGSEVAGVLGALAAIPVAGTLQILLVDWLAHHRPSGEPDAPPGVAADALKG